LKIFILYFQAFAQMLAQLTVSMFVKKRTIWTFLPQGKIEWRNVRTGHKVWRKRRPRENIALYSVHAGVVTNDSSKTHPI